MRLIDVTCLILPATHFHSPLPTAPPSSILRSNRTLRGVGETGREMMRLITTVLLSVISSSKIHPKTSKASGTQNL